MRHHKEHFRDHFGGHFKEHAKENFFERMSQHLSGRHPHGGRGLGGFGRFGGGFMDEGDRGGRGMRMGRKLGSGDLQLLILSLLVDKPRHGYEIIKALEERSGGFYAPSPGMVYPALTYLEEIGYATVTAEGTRKLYQVTESGQAHLAENQSLVELMLQQFERIGEKMDRFRRAFSDEAEPEETEERGFGRGRGSKEMMQARALLKAALIETRKSSPEEQQRIIDILKRAAADIRNPPKDPA